jgi:hypothetical protein
MEYHATTRAIREKTARLKALRLAKETADNERELVSKLAPEKL